ncbi:penicillin-binding protein [Rossellomorea vietnamensis]|uniref:transglycosylase domain-containing protein n=1 Tax=Rossellomorea vietnamensis TaxID=218284 RepID=UPI001CCDBE0C|nr:transglycosylase domain-containing protein [Rossellomorea vietnamensis]MCA0150994.1 penicillin-binding protein [Rossellomorea vietnamensis]
MKEKWNILREKLDPAIRFFSNTRLQKRARITYGVFWNLSLILIVLFVLGFAFAGGVGAGYFASLVKEEPIRPYDQMKKDIYNYEETSRLYFSDDVYLGKLRTDLEREEVKLEDISKDLQHAVIATEDEYFNEHNGVVPKAIMRAVLQEFTNSATQSGGSTLTQQLIKNQILTNEVSFERKAKEILLALRLERFFDKDEILEAYLNVATLGRNSSGQNIAGVQSAAKGIFGVDAKDLSLPQSAFIAGLPQAPFSYTPFKNNGEIKENLEAGMSRKNTVLYRMHREGYITKKQYDDAVAYDISKDFVKPKPSPREQYPWLTAELESRAVEIMKNVLAKKDGYSEQDLENNDELEDKYQTLADRNVRQSGYEIHSTINKKIYDQMQKTKDAYDMYGPTKTRTVKDPDTGKEVEIEEPVQVGAVMIENKTGRIISFIGGRDFKLEQINHATQSHRSNGSTMKPLLAYGPALEYGYISPGSPIPDVGVNINGWKPENYSFRERGLFPARFALAESLNLPAVRTYANIYNRNPFKEFLLKMGFESLSSRYDNNLSLTLGATTTGVTVEENVNAYTTFANGGKFIDAFMIDKIVDKDGNVVFEHKTEPVDVFSPQTAYLAIDMMRDTLDHSLGTGRYAKTFLNFNSDWAGKSGTSQDYKDHWFVATNPSITFGTWFGYDTPSSLNTASSRARYGHYGLRNIRLWSYLLNDVRDLAPDLIDPDASFQQPEGVVRRSFCSISGLLPSEACSQAGLVKSDLFNAKYVPTKTDDSLLMSRYVMVNGKKYLALPNTPAEFSQPGVILNPDFVKNIFGAVPGNPDKLIPDGDERFKNVLIAENKISDEGAAPGTVNASGNGNKITWTPSASGDVVGYRVYRTSGGKVGSVKSGSSLAVSVGNGDFYVVAVDVAGKESARSNTVQIGQPAPKPDPKPEKPGTDPKPPGDKPADPPPKPDKPDKPEPPPPADDGGGNGGGDGGGDGGGTEPPTEPDPPPAQN